MNKFKKFGTLALSVMLGATTLVGCGNSSDSKKTDDTTTAVTDENTTTAAKSDDDSKEETTGYGLADNTADGTILHCFSWSFNTIAESMEDIALAGYTTIQTSPVNACYDGGDAGMDLYGAGKWYYHYQPVDWTIGNYQLGTKEEFTNMCSVAEEYGIKVIVDVVPNHTTKSIEAISEDFINAVGGIDKLYHSNGKETVADYTDRAQCTLMAVGGLYDVNTENPDFQQYFIDYMNECIACGADGFRFDTAKHIGLSDDPQDDESLPNNFWTNVLSSLDNKDSLFIYGEVLQDGGERISDYIDTIGGATASAYGYSLRSCLVASNLNASTLTNYKIGDATPNIVTWVESHDNYTGDDATYETIDNDDIIVGWSILAAQKTGTPLFFARPYGADSSSEWGTFNKIGMAGDPLYKDATVSAVNHFRNAMVGEDDNIFNPDDSTKVVFIERGTKGLVIVNSSKDSYDFDVTTNLADGEYTDRVDKSTVYTVSGGKITGTIAGKSAIVLYNDGYVDLATPAVIKVADDTVSSYKSDSVDVTINVSNASEATYSIDGGEEVACADGDVVTLGEGKQPQETTTLTLKAKNDAGNQTTMTYIFKKEDTVHEGVTVSFVKPESWGDKVYAYVYDETTESNVVKNASWPGVEMTKSDTDENLYVYTFEKSWENYVPLIIFTDGTNQSNGAMEPGAAVEAGKVYECE